MQASDDQLSAEFRHRLGLLPVGLTLLSGVNAYMYIHGSTSQHLVLDTNTLIFVAFITTKQHSDYQSHIAGCITFTEFRRKFVRTHYAVMVM